MARKNYIIAGFNSILDEKGNNVFDKVTYVPCFNKVAYFKAGGRYFRLDYPDMRALKEHERKAVDRYTLVKERKYALLAECYGKLSEITMEEYQSLLREFPLTRKDFRVLGLVNGCKE